MTQRLPITGYLGRFSARPGESLAVKVSLKEPGFSPYRARLVRVISGDPNPDGPGLRYDDLAHFFDQTFIGRDQPVQLGSYAELPAPRGDEVRRTWTALIWMARPGPAKTVIAQEAGGRRLALSAGAEGAQGTLTWPGGEARLHSGVALPARKWVRLWLSADASEGRLMLGQRVEGDTASISVRTNHAALRLPSGGTVLVAAENLAGPRNHFTGKIEGPAVLDDIVEEWGPPLAHRRNGILAAWDFGRGIGETKVYDTGPGQLHGHLINLPTRGVAGAYWSGHETCWRHAPEEYAAIHFHDDDLEDCGWETDFVFDIPQKLPSGCYALRLTCNAGEDWLPFYVLAPHGGPYAPIAFLAPTFTYQAYANRAQGNANAQYAARAKAWGAISFHPDNHPEYGQSLYNCHADGSGVVFSTRLRPILTIKPAFLYINDPGGSGLRHYPADSHLLAWLEDKKIAFDVVTDEDLDDEGQPLLAPYRAVLTGSHPEYHTLRTLDALQRYVDQGGRLACLGGNAFYWRIARSSDLPHVIEVRRAEGGIRLWVAEPGEYHHALDGQLGGLWRRNRRPPQQLTGLGFSAQGDFEATYYRRLPASYDAAVSWIFEGVDGEILGDYGLSGGGAAGFELDRADVSLGTPPDAIVLARSENVPPSFVTVPEEILTHNATLAGEPPKALIRGEIVYFRNRAGGEVFSVGSITFLGSLWRKGFEGPISRLLENVVRRFSC